MPKNWNVRRPEPTIAELTQTIADLNTEAVQALRTDGEGSRPHREALSNLALAQRRLEAAQYQAEELDRMGKLTPNEIVDRAMGF